LLFGATLPERGQMQHVAGCHDVPLVLGVGDLEAVHGLKKEEKEIWKAILLISIKKKSSCCCNNVKKRSKNVKIMFYM
jgi:hypothetical protein